MEFGKHIGKGVWAFADKALPAVYGIGFVLLVVRGLPEKEFGAFVVIQTMFTIVTAFATSFALQPLTKFAAETDRPGNYIVTSLLMQFFFFLLASIAALAFKDTLAILLDRQHQTNLVPLISYLPLLLVTAYYRNFAASLLQARYRVERIFWIDAVYFLGVLGAVFMTREAGVFHSASDMLSINVLMLACSSLLAIVLTWREMSSPLLLDSQAIKAMWNFGKYTFGGSVTYILFSQMDIFFVTSIAGIVAVATYNAAKVLTRLFDMVAQVLQMFLIPFSSKAHAKRETDKLTSVAEKSICFAMLVLIPVFIAMFFFPELILHLLYKGKYDSGASIVRVFGFLAFIVPWSTVAGGYMVGIGKVKEGLYSGVALLGIALPAYMLLTPVAGALGTSIGYVASYLFMTLVLVNLLKPQVHLKIFGVLNRVEDAWVYVKTKIHFR